jgi:hypothetical protein
MKLENYQHFRNITHEEYKKKIGIFIIIENDDAIFRFDILEPLTLDLPNGCWSIQSSTIRS